MLMILISVFLYFKFAVLSEWWYYFIISIVGFATGYWAVFMSTAAELFGTNIRATATTTAPNFVRGAVIFLTMGFRGLENALPLVDGRPDTKGAAIGVGLVVAVLATLAWLNLKETFHKDLNYTE